MHHLPRRLDRSAFGFVGFAQPSCVLRRRPEESTGARLHLGLCGHAVHVDCLEKHVASLRQRANANAQFDGRAAVDIQKGEFLCPLCKRLSNTLVPQMCVSADERELAVRRSPAPLPTPPTAPAQRVLAFRRLLRPHLRRGDRAPSGRGSAPAAPPRRRRARRRRLAPNVGGAGRRLGGGGAGGGDGGGEDDQAERRAWRSSRPRRTRRGRGGDGGGARAIDAVANDAGAGAHSAAKRGAASRGGGGRRRRRGAGGGGGGGRAGRCCRRWRRGGRRRAATAAEGEAEGAPARSAPAARGCGGRAFGAEACVPRPEGRRGAAYHARMAVYDWKPTRRRTTSPSWRRRRSSNNCG